MSANQVIVQGTLKADGSLELDEKLVRLPPGRVQVIVQSLEPADPSRPGLLEVLDQIHREQRARGIKGLSEQEMEAEIAALRAEDEESEQRWRQIWSETQDVPQPDEAP